MKDLATDTWQRMKTQVLLSANGLLIHIDFGYILGRDPKPMPPPFKLVKEMVDAMGGHHSSVYA